MIRKYKITWLVQHDPRVPSYSEEEDILNAYDAEDAMVQSQLEMGRRFAAPVMLSLEPYEIPSVGEVQEPTG